MTQIRSFVLMVCAVLALAIDARAQSKPIGLMGVSCETRPEWAAFGQLAEWDDFDAAAACSRRTGMAWVMSIYYGAQPDTLEQHTRLVRARADAAGLAPFVWALTYREEWYEHWRLALPLPHDLKVRGVVDEVAGIRRVHDYLGRSHASIRRGWPGVPIGWITGFVNDSLAYGPDLYAPMPAGVDVLVLDPYAGRFQSFESWPELVIQHAVATTRQPIVIVPQWFTAPGTTFTERTDFTAHYARWLTHPRVVGLWGFVWESRGDVVGLRDLLALRLAVETRIR